MSRGPAGVLWDMDGTVVDTELYYIESLTSIVAAHGGVLGEEDHHAVVGANLWDMATIAIRAGARRPAAEIVEEIVAEVALRLRDGIPWRPGALDLLAALRTSRVPTALVTMAFRSSAVEVVRGIPFPAFDVVVTGEDVSRGKPDPEAYLLAAALLGVDVAECVVIEDSPPGVAAGVAAGASVVAVPCYVDLPASEAYTTWDSLVGKDHAALVAEFRGRRSPDRPDSADRLPA
ncbi:HAD family phosphatase [Pseudonocardia aurantiaca]|uniref:HAD family hydrolase n=1 Tax=Pseudonocardia aurantiaca TaxID=75290 RepID=A0ABW4FWA6_9PSEU